MTRFRILDLRTGESWKPFGVAYERDGRVVLFAPPWRADRTLTAATLEELGERHLPGKGYQWRALETVTESASHPIDILRRTLTVSHPRQGPQASGDGCSISIPEEKQSSPTVPLAGGSEDDAASRE